MEGFEKCKLILDGLNPPKGNCFISTREIEATYKERGCDLNPPKGNCFISTDKNITEEKFVREVSIPRRGIVLFLHNGGFKNVEENGKSQSPEGELFYFYSAAWKPLHIMALRHSFSQPIFSHIKKAIFLVM